MSKETLNCDYSKWLGPDYVPPEKYSTIVCNHTSYCEVCALHYFWLPGMVAKAEVANAPLIGKCA